MQQVNEICYDLKDKPRFVVPTVQQLVDCFRTTLLDWLPIACAEYPAFEVTIDDSMDTLYVYHVHNSYMENDRVVHAPCWLLVQNYHLEDKQYDPSYTVPVFYARGIEDIYYHIARVFIPEDDPFWVQANDDEVYFYQPFYVY